MAVGVGVGGRGVAQVFVGRRVVSSNHINLQVPGASKRNELRVDYPGILSLRVKNLPFSPRMP